MRMDLSTFPCKLDKTPAIPHGVSWRTGGPWEHWPTHIIGVPVPAGTVVIDLDTYKGITREAAEAAIGCALPWDEALLQTTQQGGQHYGFRVEWDVRQGSNLLGLKGLDTRVGGKGYICTGEPDYKAFNGFGVLRLAQPGLLPRLPDAARTALEHVETTIPTTPGAPPPDFQTVIEALRHINPACSRTTWLKVGLALRTITEDVTLFDQWSSGVLGGHEVPVNYVPEHIYHQWPGFKPDGKVGIGSLFFEAIQAGWRPPATLDTALAFGATGVSPDLIQSILEHGCDPEHTASLTTQCAGNPILLALLSRELKEAGLLSKPLRAQLDAAAGGPGSTTRAPGEYGSNHTENAIMYLGARYPSGGLRYSDETWYAYDGQCWVEHSDGDIGHALTVDMVGSTPQNSTLTGTYGVLSRLCHFTGSRINEIDPSLILFQNGVLNLRTGALGAHSPEYFTTNILPYGFDPAAQALRWLAFLGEVFEGDPDRIALLQEWFGYMLSNGTQHHKILFMIGTGRSGKGTIGRMLEQVVGAYNFTGFGLDQLASDSFLESLRTKTVAFSGDISGSVGRNLGPLVTEHLKKISGEDSLSFSRKYKPNVNQILPTRLTLSGNNTLRLFDDSGALGDRTLMLPFNVSWLNREDHGLYSRLLTELPGIATWALAGLARLNATSRFTESEAGRQEAAYQAEMSSPMRPFIEDVITFDPHPDAIVTGADLHTAYRVWALAQGEPPMARRAFTIAFKDTIRGRGAQYGRYQIDDRQQRGFRGIRVGHVDTHTARAFSPSVVKT